MGRPRRYGSGAERQRAFRERQERETRRVDRRALEGLEGRLNALQEAVLAAASAGDEVAKRSQAVGVETMLEKLTRYFAGSARERKEGKEGD